MQCKRRNFGVSDETRNSSSSRVLCIGNVFIIAEQNSFSCIFVLNYMDRKRGDEGVKQIDHFLYVVLIYLQDYPIVHANLGFLLKLNHRYFSSWRCLCCNTPSANLNSCAASHPGYPRGHRTKESCPSWQASRWVQFRVSLPKPYCHTFLSYFKARVDWLPYICHLFVWQ